MLDNHSLAPGVTGGQEKWFYFWYYANAVHVSSTVGHDFIPLEMGNGPSAEDVTHTTSNSQKHPLCNITLHQPSYILSQQPSISFSENWKTAD